MSIGVAGDIVLVDVEFVTGLIGIFVTSFIDAFVRGKVVVIGCAESRNF